MLPIFLVLLFKILFVGITFFAADLFYFLLLYLPPKYHFYIYFKALVDKKQLQGSGEKRR